MRQRFFLILSASGGAGHLRAAEALERTARQSDLPLKVENYDCLDFTSKLFKKLYAQSYLSIVNRAPEVYGFLYQKSEQKPYSKKGLLNLFDHLNYKRYIKSLKDLQPDAIICTHFLPFISISNEAKKFGLTTPFFAATTDFDIHQYWVDSIVRKYYVYHEESAWQLESKGISRNMISVKGIPLNPEFTTAIGKEEAMKQLGLDNSRFTLLVISGGFGVGKVQEIVEHVAVTLGNIPEKKFNLVVICGKNEKTRAALSRTRFAPNIQAQIHGFVTNIYLYMEASDVLVTKSGGLTSAEAMAKSLPMIIIDPIPGQETRNADLIVEHGAGWKAINLPNLSYKLQKLIAQPGVLAKMREATTMLAKPNAAEEILKDVYSFLDSAKGGAV